MNYYMCLQYSCTSTKENTGLIVEFKSQFFWMDIYTTFSFQKPCSVCFGEHKHVVSLVMIVCNQHFMRKNIQED